MDFKEMVLLTMRKSNIELLATQSCLSLPILERMYLKMTHGIKFESIKVDDVLIIDGHHRYIASLLAGVKLDRVPSCRTSATVGCSWQHIALDEKDWDSVAKIRRLNEYDALNNNISLARILEFLR